MDNKHTQKKDCPTCRWGCGEGNDHPQWGAEWVIQHFDSKGDSEDCPLWEEFNGNSKYILIPDGMTTEEAVRYLEHGPDMVEIINMLTAEREWQGRDSEDLLNQGILYIAKVSAKARALNMKMEGK